eukprot:scaffold305_cov247-Pinguiococcus_pyrenoidosus.AAC.28
MLQRLWHERRRVPAPSPPRAFRPRALAGLLRRIRGIAVTRSISPAFGRSKLRRRSTAARSRELLSAFLLLKRGIFGGGSWFGHVVDVRDSLTSDQTIF